MGGSDNPPAGARILADAPPAPAFAREPARLRRYARFGLVALALTGAVAFGLAPDTRLETVDVRPVFRDLPLPDVSPLAPPPAVLWRDEPIRPGDTIGALLARAGVDDPAAQAFVRTDPAARPLYRLRPGGTVRVATRGDGRLVELAFATAEGRLTLVREGDALRAVLDPAPRQARAVVAAGVIEDSLFGAADAAGLPDAITMGIADALAGDIDFNLDMRRGDRFVVVYEMLDGDGEPARPGRVLAVEFVNRGKTYTVYRWTGPDGQDGYYTLEGRSARKSFLRSPMAFSRVTSGFSLRRMHPIHKSWRAHTGVDYGAPTGTPVRATGDGVVAFAGARGGYGNLVVLRHAGAYSTYYAHLSRFGAGVRTGARVSQGQTIGHVGSTGWATGPHLHYEFRVNDAPRNPLTLALPAAEPVPPSERGAFRAAIATNADLLDLARRTPALVASSARS